MFSGRAVVRVDRRDIQLAVTNLLRNHEIRHGLSAQDIREAVELLAQDIEVSDKVIARDTPSRPCQDASIELKVPLKTEHKPTVKDEGAGKQDFRDRGTIPTIEPDTKVAVPNLAVPSEPRTRRTEQFPARARGARAAPA